MDFKAIKYDECIWIFKHNFFALLPIIRPSETALPSPPYKYSYLPNDQTVDAFVIHSFLPCHTFIDVN